MKQQLILTLAAGLLGGVVGAAVLDALQSAPENEPVANPSVALLGERLDDLARENTQLREQLTRLEDRPMMSAPVRADVARETASSPEEDRIVAMLEEFQESNDKGQGLPENFKLQVGNVIKEIRAQEEEQREQRREEARQARREQQLRQLAEKLGMDAYQTNEMRKILSDQDALISQARSEIRASGDWTAMRETMRSAREQTIQSISLFLTPTQVGLYEETNSDHAFGGFRGGRTDRGGRGGSRGSGGNSGRR